jgi:cytoskeletal protein RodZ
MKIILGYGSFLTEKRIEKGLTIRQISEGTGVPVRNIEAIETENIRRFSLHQITLYIRFLGVPLSEVIYE